MDYIEEIRAEMRQDARRFTIQLILLLTAAVGVVLGAYAGHRAPPALPMQQEVVR